MSRLLDSLAKDPKKLMIAIIAAYFTIFLALAILKHESFHSTAFDLGIFDQNVWMFSKGHSAVNTVNGFQPFADHIQPILFIPAAIYKFVDSPIVLLVLQVAMISLGAIPLYLLAKKKLGGKIAAAFVFAYFMYSPTQYLTLFDFHTEAFLILFLLFAIYFLIEKSTGWLFVFLFLAGLTKEYIPIIFLFFAAYMLIMQKRKKAAAAAALIGIAWLALNYGIVLNSYQYNSLHIYQGYYGSQATLGGKIASIITGLFTIDKIGYTFLMLFPLAGLSLLGIELLPFAAPGLALVLLKSSTTYKSIITHHTAFIMPFLFAAAVMGFQRAVRIFGEKRKKILTIALLLCSIASFAAYGPFTVLYNANTFNAWSSHAKSGHELLKNIPQDAVVSATTWAVPHLSERSKIYMFPAPFIYYGSDLPEGQKAQWLDTTPDYVVLDTSRKDIMLDDKLIQAQSCELAMTGRYTITYDKNGWILLKRSAEGKNAADRLCAQTR